MEGCCIESERGGGGGGGNSHEVYYSFSLKVQLYMKT